MAQNQKTALEAAAAILNRRACSCTELRRKLYQKECYSPAEINEAIARLQKMGYLSDLRFAEDFVRVMRERHYGNGSISAKLYKKGIGRDIIMQVLNADSDEQDPLANAMALLESRARRLNNVTDPQKLSYRIICMLSGRGFSSDVSYKAMKAWLARGKDEA